jgi:hypothetical protein
MEVVALKVCDIDSKRMTLRVEQGKNRQHHDLLSGLARPLVLAGRHAQNPHPS